MPRKRPRPQLYALLAECDARVSWSQLEAVDPEEWLQLSDREQQEAIRRAHQAELDG